MESPARFMVISRCLNLLLCLCAVLPVMSQAIPEQVTVDPWLTVTFPGKVTHTDTLGVTLIQTTVDRTTYQMVKRDHIFQQATQDQRSDLMDLAVQSMTGNSKFEGLTKRVLDSVIGGSRGRFIQMGKSDTVKPYHVFIFVTIKDNNIYLLQCTSFNSLVKCMRDVHYFYSHAIFQGLQQ